MAENVELPDRCVNAESTGDIMVDVSELFWLILFIALPVASLVVLAAGLLCRRDRPVWLLWCAVAVPASALAILLVMLPEAGDDSLMLALIVWFAICLLVLGLALGRRWRGERSRRLERCDDSASFVASLPPKQA